MPIKNNLIKGFTLLEILIAMFIFAILSLLLLNALHNVIGTQSRTEQNASRLRETQLALLIMSRDITQAVNRPITTAASKVDGPFVARPQTFSMTHDGFANTNGEALHSSLQRVQYFIEGNTLWRAAWDVLDQAPQSTAHKRKLLEGLNQASFEYVDSKGKSHSEWPPQDGPKDPLPSAVKINLTISQWGKLSELYVIPAQTSQAAASAPPGASPPPKH